MNDLKADRFITGGTGVENKENDLAIRTCIYNTGKFLRLLIIHVMKWFQIEQPHF